MNRRTCALMILLGFFVLPNGLVNMSGSAQHDKTLCTNSFKRPSDPIAYFIPENGTGTPDHYVTFGWFSGENSDKYLLQVDDSVNFDSLDLEAHTTESNLTSKCPLSDGTFHWRVRVFNTRDESAWLWRGIASFFV